MQPRHVLAPVLVVICVIVVWATLSATGAVSAFVLPAPQAVAYRIVTGISSGFLISAAWQTLHVALLGSFIAALIGVPMGFTIAHSPLFSATFEPFLAASQAIPAVAFAPLMVLWLGYGAVPIVSLCVLIIVFPMIITTAMGVRGVDPEIIDAACLDGASGFKLWTIIEFPLALPAILAGIRTGVTLSITGAIVGELVIGGPRGLGTELVTAQNLNDASGMFAIVAFLALLAVLFYISLRAIEARVLAKVR